MTSFVPLQRIVERISRDKDNSNSAYFSSLLLGYELALKLAVAGFVASVQDDKDRHRYRFEHRLVRASGLGDWVATLKELFTGPAAASMTKGVLDYRTELMQKVNEDDYRFNAVRKLEIAMQSLGISHEPVTAKPNLLQWFGNATTLRNKTRGHGATTQTKIDAACQDLDESLTEIITHFPMFECSWAYLRRNYSGKYRVCPMTNDDSRFAHMRSERELNYAEGIYIGFDTLCPVSLVSSDPDLSDFFVANGDFKKTGFSCLSYVTDETLTRDSTPYLLPIEKLPGSVTEGGSALHIVGDSFSNLPEEPSEYVTRPELESKIEKELISNDHHPIVTLDGRGGIGKTSAALRVIHKLLDSAELPYEEVYWFSARDIDLMPEGAKVVRPATVTISDFSAQYCSLNEITKQDRTGQTETEKFSERLAGQSGPAALFVFDNFETVDSPGEAFTWIDSFLRPPNKAVITTRIRGEFRGDFQIPVRGMEDTECRELIGRTSARLGIAARIDAGFEEKIIEESEGRANANFG